MTTFESLDLLPDSVLRRRTMVDCQIRTFDVTDPGVIARFLEVPRELFLPAKWRALAYSDNALEIQTDSESGPSRQLLPPLVLARLMQGASLKAGERVLDIASGTGYSTALLAGLAGEVTTLESDTAFAALIKSNLEACGLHADVAVGALPLGVAKKAPYDVIFVNGAVEAELETLFQQLNEGGRLLTIQRGSEDSSSRANKAVRFEKIAGEVSARFLFDASANLLAAFQKSPQFVF
jgi:protein-L-isoaspartate(D-aspartate) O-methyltransferase